MKRSYSSYRRIFVRSLALCSLALVGITTSLSAITDPKISQRKTPMSPITETASMSQTSLESLIRRLASNIEGNAGAIQFTYAGVSIACISDTTHDRMRLVSPITATDSLTTEQVINMLEANYHTALDGRYATSDGVVYAAFIHPLSPLTEAQLISALNQVANLSKSFGSSYTSGELTFGEQGNTL